MKGNDGVKDLYLLRHGDTGKTGRYIGSTDIGITPGGLEKVRRSGQFLKGVELDRIYCSPKLRCMQTLQGLELSPEVVFDRNLVEIDFGDWEGKSFDEVNSSAPERISQWIAHPETFCFPNGESIAGFRDRIERIEKMIRECKARKILLISHGGVIRHLLCALLKIPYDHYLIFNVQPGDIATMQIFSEGGILTGFNLAGS